MALLSGRPHRRVCQPVQGPEPISTKRRAKYHRRGSDHSALSMVDALHRRRRVPCQVLQNRHPVCVKSGRRIPYAQLRVVRTDACTRGRINIEIHSNLHRVTHETKRRGTSSRAFYCYTMPQLPDSRGGEVAEQIGGRHRCKYLIVVKE